MIARTTAHVDRFAEERLPPPEAMPDVIDVLELDYPARVNFAGRLLDAHIERGGAHDRCVLSPSARWSYAELRARANRIARVLTEDLMLEPGNRVLLRGTNTPMLAACWFAVLKAGGIAVTTMPLYRAGELRFMMEKAQVKHALCDARLRDEFDRACASFGGVRARFFNAPDENHQDSLERAMEAKSEDFADIQTGGGDVALIAFTSGTTGTPKAAMHYHRDLLAICDTYCARVLRPQSDELFCGSPPLGFTFGLGGQLLFPLHVGAATLLLERAGPAELLEAIDKFGITTIFTAPIAYRTMAAACDRYDISTLRACVSAGEALPKVVWEEWHEKTGLKILDGIGSTEMLHIFIGSPLDEARPGSTGRVVPGYVAEIHDDDGRPLPDGTMGRLAVKGPTGCKYLQDERQSIYVQRGWNYPGDAYRRDGDGYFWYVARTDDMIVSAGYNISGPEVEQALIAHPDVKEVAVVGKRDPEKETNLVKAFVVLAEGCAANDAKADELREFCKTQIAPFKAPREIEFVAELPRTETGKLQRYKLRQNSSAG
ncbi:MAG TPA: AMP-binding protein [Candidatus Baltobacteraceae bacterium]|jgi:2-aminobenzoate-CoA ligase|nr:AMP-binding protein [Candidatus Baltobacteraceae bacterium]